MDVDLAPTVADDGALWSPKLGERVTLRASAESYDSRRIAATAIAAAALLALITVGALALVRRRGAR